MESLQQIAAKEQWQTLMGSMRVHWQPHVAEVEMQFRLAGRLDCSPDLARFAALVRILWEERLKANEPQAHPWMANSTAATKQEMLDAIGATSIAELFEQ